MLNEIFEKNPYMRRLYPGDSRSALMVLRIYDVQGEYFDISDPSHIVRESFVIGNKEVMQSGYFITDVCTGCGTCFDVCPQKCIDFIKKSAVIEQNHYLHCGRFAEACPVSAIEKR